MALLPQRGGLLLPLLRMAEAFSQLRAKIASFLNSVSLDTLEAEQEGGPLSLQEAWVLKKLIARATLQIGSKQGQ